MTENFANIEERPTNPRSIGTYCGCVNNVILLQINFTKEDILYFEHFIRFTPQNLTINAKYTHITATKNAF